MKTWKIDLSKDSEKMINNLINVLFASAYRCKSTTYYFEQTNIGLFGLANLHLWSSVSDLMWARGLLEYLKLRGGRPDFEDVPAPSDKEGQLGYIVVEQDGTPRFEPVSQETVDEETFVIKSLDCLLLGKREVYDYLLKVYQTACDSNDAHLTDFLEVNYIRPIVNVNRKLAILRSHAQLACQEGSVGVYQFNKDVQGNLLKIIMVNKLVRPDKWSAVF